MLRDVAPSARPSEVPPRRVAREFRALLASGAVLRPAGAARKRPAVLLARGYAPRHKIELFDTTFYLTDARQNPDIRFFVAYLVKGTPRRGTPVHPRILYKDVSLVWRSASHFIRSHDENWIGKGDLKTTVVNGEEIEYADEATTNLPLEIQTALEVVLRRAARVRRDDAAISLVLRRGPDDRLAPYRDFSEPRRRAGADPRNRVNRGRPVARFTRRNDPESLVFTPGFEPDFARGVAERSESRSRLYGGRVRRFRVVSRNRQVQYLFFAGPHQVWIAPAQTTGRELTSYGVRPVDVPADEDLFVPGYEYHYVDDTVDPPVLVSQIPEGFAGDPSAEDPARADASAWLERLPVVRAFRREVLGRSAGAPTRSPRADRSAGSSRAPGACSAGSRR